MTPSEFKSWFDGFTEGLEGIPNDKQWERIKERVSDINGQPTSYPVYVDRYRPYLYGIPYNGYPIWTSGVAGCAGNQNPLSSAQNAFDAHAALTSLGKAEALSIQSA